MQIISAALAFAITMLVLSMLVASLVETIHRLLAMRERGLYYLLGRFYDDVLGPYRRNPNNPAWRPSPALRADFQDRMSELRTPVGLTVSTGTARTSTSLLDWGNPNAAPGPTGLVQRSKNFLSALLGGLIANWRGRGLSNLTCIEFMTRLGAHPLSDRIIAKAEAVAAAPTPPPGPAAGNATPAAGNPPPNPIDIVLQDIALKFEIYGNEASVSFERRARTLSVTVAFVVALVLHVNAVDIFTTLVQNPAVAEAVIARKDELTKDANATVAAMEKKIPAVAATGAELQVLQQAAKEIDALKKEYADAVAKLKGAESQLAGLGVPIGWTEERKRAAAFWPEWKWYSCEKAGEPARHVKANEQCRTGEKRVTSIGFGVPTAWSVLFGLLLGGLLVGLGSPFWAQMVNSLTNIRNVARGQTTPSQGTPSPTADVSAGAGGAKETPQPRTPVDAFKAARAGWIAAGRPAVRTQQPKEQKGMAQTYSIEITKMAFPDETKIAAGDTIVWTNRMSMNHTVTADNGEFDAGVLGKDKSFSQTFNQPGTIAYHCEIHPNMTGAIIVT
ncbi:MAG: hypothetical protein QOH67_404 [Hyphomicrobiales bacterium]|jgi:plastocyanin|nr:hypothetical protein [Hyphomicrobiales bacterium]